MSITPLFADRNHLRHFWHPVCTFKEFECANFSGNGPMSVTLLGEAIALARIEGRVVAFKDRCAHRFAKLSKGCVKNGRVECPYHGWQYDRDGACQHIPACPDAPIPRKARVETYECEVKYDLVWVRLDGSYGPIDIPAFTEWDNKAMRIVVADSYVWKTSAERRWENFTDFSHFAFVHPGTLYDKAFANVPIRAVDRVSGELRFSIEPPREMLEGLPADSPLGTFNYRCTMPFTVNLEICLYRNDRRFVLWTTSCPIDDGTCRNFMIIAREWSDDADHTHLAFQKRVLDEDQPVIESQWPAQITMEEISLATDKVSVQYRKWLRELSIAAKDGADEFRRVLYTEAREDGEGSQNSR